MNSVSTELNNRAVAYLQSGNSVQAFQLLSTNAYNIALQGVPNHTHVDSNRSPFRFHWEDCSRAITSNHSSSSLCEQGSTCFLFLRALRVSVSDDVDVDELCSCGYAWVIWYNLAICCSVIGTRLGERGRKLLETAFHLYSRVQRRIYSEPSSKHWDLLQMAAINNQACIYHDYGMEAKTRECLEQLASIVLESINFESEDKTRAFFPFNLQILGTVSVASAA
jgi:hypothetical protein